MTSLERVRHTHAFRASDVVLFENDLPDLYAERVAAASGAPA